MRELSVGVDLVDVAEVEQAMSHFGERYLARIYTPGELAYALAAPTEAARRLGARFAAKEAGMKALGTGWRRGIQWKDFEVVNLPSGRPTLLLHGEAEAIAKRAGVNSIQLSLTHTSKDALAHVIFEG